ncbi:hypothetical protein ACH3VR_22140 [Microbacterium sp. B2969]|uniref:Uncharacterized protein n=1 Tax=Microbacterium alkaliflavum TaxID=3248839 RepID=A0ABW7QE18_9MICO
MSALYGSAAASVSDEIYRDWSADRWAGSRVPAFCDWPTCQVEINRGRDFRCVAHGVDDGCELFFCPRHLVQIAVHDLVRPKPDHARWELMILTDDTLEPWRQNHPTELEQERRRQEHTTLRETLNDLAQSADRQAARAAALSGLAQSSRLFHLADELRRAAAALGGTMSRDDVLEVLDGAQRVVVTAMLQLDAAERTVEI